MEFEYMVADWDTADFMIDRKLDRAGTTGWELVTVVMLPDQPGTFRFFFKRPKKIFRICIF